jgi:hypothetical protein
MQPPGPRKSWISDDCALPLAEGRANRRSVRKVCNAPLGKRWSTKPSPYPKGKIGVATMPIWLHTIGMTDDARERLREICAKVGARALTRLHEMHPHLQGKTLEETTAILRREEPQRKWGPHPLDRPPQTRRDTTG